jgi:uncharacterized protein involved in exopolysaccharide biosynthesis
MGDGVLVSDLSQRFEDGLSARAILSSIRRHLAMVLAFTLSLCIAGALVGLGLPAWFKAEGVVVVHSRPQRTADLQELPDPSFDLNVIQSEVDILQSRSVIEPVALAARLWRRLNFRNENIPKVELANCRGAPRRDKAGPRGALTARKMTPAAAPGHPPARWCQSTK